MAEILRPNFDKLWASAGRVIEPSELKIESGWMEEVPPSQWENWIQLRQDQAIKYIFQRGIPAWDAKEEYFAGRSAVLLDGDIYIALRNNVNKSPKTNAADWRVVTKDLTIANITGLQAALDNKADKTVSITGVGGLTGGGNLSANRTIDLSAATKNSLTLADGALQKTQNLNDLPDKATARYNLGLGTAATRNVGEESGNLMPVGAFGLGRTDYRTGSDVTIGDLNNEKLPAGFYNFTQTSENSPSRTGSLMVIPYRLSGGQVFTAQLAITTKYDSSTEIFFRKFGISTGDVWTDWYQFYHSGNFNPTTKANTTTQIIAGNGLSGGGNLTTNRTLTLGTPSSVTKTSTNSVTATSHTHALSTDVKNSLSLADGSLQKAQNLSDLPNKATARSNLGLGTAATRNVTSGLSDVTSGRVLKVGDLGSNKHNAIVVNFDNLPELYPYSGLVPVMSYSTSTNRPPRGDLHHVFQTFHSGNANNVTQLAIPHRVDEDGFFLRNRLDGNWSPWREVYHTGNFDPNNKANVSNPGSMGIGVGQTWQDVTNSRALETTYTNTTGRAIVVSVSVQDNLTKGTAAIRVIVGGEIIHQQEMDSQGTKTILNAFFIVPHGVSYRVVNMTVDGTDANDILHKWVELR